MQDQALDLEAKALAARQRAERAEAERDRLIRLHNEDDDWYADWQELTARAERAEAQQQADFNRFERALDRAIRAEARNAAALPIVAELEGVAPGTVERVRRALTDGAAAAPASEHRCMVEPGTDYCMTCGLLERGCAERTIAALQARIDAALELHPNQPDNNGWCCGCGCAWPCATRRALTGGDDV